jgi:hypothetical protein
MSLARTAKAVAWAFLGVRRKSEYEQDLGQIKPVHIILAALAAVVLLVGGLMALVHWIV